MITCREAADLVTEYLEGTLPRRQRFAVWLHLLVCRSCREHLDKMRVLVASLGRIPPDTAAPPELLARLATVLQRP